MEFRLAMKRGAFIDHVTDFNQHVPFFLACRFNHDHQPAKAEYRDRESQAFHVLTEERIVQAVEHHRNGDQDEHSIERLHDG